MEDPREREIMRPYPPLGMLYVSAYLEENGFDNFVFDSTFSTFTEQKQYILEHRPEYLMVYVNLMTRLNVLRLIRFIRESPDLSETRIILGGPEVKYHAENLLKSGADVIIIGEGEETAVELVRQLEKNPEPENLKDIPGLAFINGNNEAEFSPERTKIREIDTLPLPNRKKINLHQYLEAWKSHHGQSAMSVSTMRGCPYTCKWCSRAVYGLSYRRRSPARVADELEWIQKTYNPDSIWFVDDVFTVSHKWLADFRDEILERGIQLPYECITRADRMNEEVIGMLKESGCFRVWIGAESGSQKIIDLMDRRVDVNKVRDMIIKAREAGIQAGTFIMLGYPGETEKDIEETIHHLKTSNPDYFTITVAYPIRGTELYAEVEHLHTREFDWNISTDRDIDFERTYPRNYYDWAVRRVVNEVNFHKNALIQHPYNLKGLQLKSKSLAARFGMWWIRTRAGAPKH